jgi:quercetin dioxygenase-like cupin family protein
VAVLEGNPASAGPVTIRLKLPPDYTLAPHIHGGDERVTVLSGTLYFNVGDKIDKAMAKALPAGSFFIMPAGTSMFGFTTAEETVIQLNVDGPWTVTYINPADDPRKK